MEIGQIVAALNSALQALSQMENETKPKPSSGDYTKIITLARKNPFANHILSARDETIRDLYMTALFALFFNADADESVTDNQMLILGRIIASFNQAIDFERYIVRRAKMDRTFWNSFSDFINGDLKICFAVDAMLVFNMSQSKSSDAIKAMVDVFEILGLDKKQLEKAARIARAIMEQNFRMLLDTVDAADTFNYTPFLCYFPGEHWNHITNNLLAAKVLGGKVVITGAAEKNIGEQIHLDEYAASELYFYHCSFVGTCGFTAKKVKTSFCNCVFQDSMIPEVEITVLKTGWKKPDKEHIFLNLTSTTITSSRFVNCKTVKNLLCLTESSLVDCSFQECRGENLPCTYLIQLNMSVMESCTFSDCRIETEKAAREHTTGGLINATESKILKSSFIKCLAKGKTAYERFPKIDVFIIRTSESKIERCLFESCNCEYEKGDHFIEAKNYILGLHNSTEQDNTFSECTATHRDRFTPLDYGKHYVGKI